MCVVNISVLYNMIYIARFILNSSLYDTLCPASDFSFRDS